MKIDDKVMLGRFRGYGWCEICKKRRKVEPHHSWQKTGMGGGSRLDIRINLIAVCRSCHNNCEEELVTRDEVLKIVARRELTTPEDIIAVIDFLWKLPKHMDPDSNSQGLAESARVLLTKTMDEAPV